MKKLLLISLIAQALVAPLLANKVLFIQNFQNNTKDSKYDHVGASLADMVISDIVALKIDGISVVEREQIKSLLSELKLQESEYFDQTSTQKMGKGLGANYALAGSFTVMNGVMRIDARLINVTTSKIHSSFKTKGDEEAIFDLEADLVKNIGKGLEIDFGDVSRDKLSSPKELDTLVKYADADKLMQQGDYKAATKILGEMRKSEPEFKLGKEAYKEAMKNLYAAVEKREISFADSAEKLLASVREKKTNAIQTKKTDQAIAYSVILSELYYLRLQKIGGLRTYRRKDGAFDPRFALWAYDFERPRFLFMFLPPFADDDVFLNPEQWQPKAIPKNKIEEFKKALNLYVEAHLSVINRVKNHISNDDPVWYINSDEHIDAVDRKLMDAIGMKLPSELPDEGGASIMATNLAHFLLFAWDFSPAPCQMDEKYKKMGWKLLERARNETLDKKCPFASWRSREDSACQIMDIHGLSLLKHGRVEDAIAMWQEILDNHPTYGGFHDIKDKIKQALK